VSSGTWTPHAVASELRPWSARAWRVVEAQHVASTMKLVDTLEEQDVLEALIESSKPPPPRVAPPLHYLLAAPFRYDAPPGGSRFRGESDPGVFYGAETVRTACAELGYWRWRFLLDAEGLDEIGPVSHTAFSVRLKTSAIDLRRPPFNRDAATWTHRSDYRGTQAFGRSAREAGAGAVIYRSVRDPVPGWCAAVLTPASFARHKPDATTQTWWLVVRPDGANWRRPQGESLIFSADSWC
jgi:hypothetical protein